MCLRMCFKVNCLLEGLVAAFTGEREGARFRVNFGDMGPELMMFFEVLVTFCTLRSNEHLAYKRKVKERSLLHMLFPCERLQCVSSDVVQSKTSFRTRHIHSSSPSRKDGFACVPLDESPSKRSMNSDYKKKVSTLRSSQP